MIDGYKAGTGMLNTAYGPEDDSYWEAYRLFLHESWQNKSFSSGIRVTLNHLHVKGFVRLTAGAKFWLAAGATAWPAFLGTMVGLIVGLIAGMLLGWIADFFVWSWLASLAPLVFGLAGAAFGFGAGDKALARKYYS